jgi:pimeloyl-ACP methyl ester carboxylesterase
MSPKLLEHTLVESDFSGGVELQRIANAGHFLHLEQPEVINDHLLRLLNNTRCD